MKKISLRGWSNIKQSRYDLTPIVDKKAQSYYFLSNDVVPENQFKKSGAEDGRYIAIGNIHSLHVLSNILEHNRLKELFFVDINYSQLRHLQATIELIKKSKTRIEFVERFFQVKLSPGGKKILSGFSTDDARVSGYEQGKNQLEIEERVWSKAVFEKAKFRKNYRIEAELFELGLKASSDPNFGNITNCTYHIIACNKALPDHEPFTLGYGSGFLKSELSFRKLKKILNTIVTYYIFGDIASVTQEILPAVRYQTIFLWTSNIFDPYFMKRYKPIEKFKKTLNTLGTQKEPVLPEYEIISLYDSRSKAKFKRELTVGRKSLSAHTHAFKRISSELLDNNLEIVSKKNWITEDNGVSKLYLTNYFLFENNKYNLDKYDCIFLHCLLSEGLDKVLFIKLVKKIKKLNKKIVILEHNKNSIDFKKQRGRLHSLEECLTMLGKPKRHEYVQGKKTLDRNILLIY